CKLKGHCRRYYYHHQWHIHRPCRNSGSSGRQSMDRCPPEICGEIYSFACLDDGRTGRSLSLVSKFTHETSKPYKLQSVSLIGHAQLYAFADLVERTPEHLRRVKCIFVSAHSRETAILPRTIAPEYHRRMDVYAAFKRILTAIAPCVQIVHVFFVFFRPFVLCPLVFHYWKNS
ncbi:hypothetical protein BJ912DRAFT_1081105, partial [Pholiota molesta]